MPGMWQAGKKLFISMPTALFIVVTEFISYPECFESYEFNCNYNGQCIAGNNIELINVASAICNLTTLPGCIGAEKVSVQQREN